MSRPANDHRRETPLLQNLRTRIRQSGPLPVHLYANLCLTDPTHGYYTTQPALGAGGDFITAPEISQIFGELLGLWVAVTWQSMGQPERLQLVELGPGRGTLMSDALRAMHNVPGLNSALSVVLVEINPTLKTEQIVHLKDFDLPMQWVTRFEDIPTDCATIIIGNEFLDTLIAPQYIVTESGIRLRTVALDDTDTLCFSHALAGPIPADVAERLTDAPVGTICEDFPEPADLLDTLSRTSPNPVAAVLIDYGHENAGRGETLQAVRAHHFEDILTSPGEADLSVQVDFAKIASCAAARGLAVDGPKPQAEFLGHLGMIERASHLMNANPDAASTIEASVLRLMAPNGMGTRFKAIGLRSAELPQLAGFFNSAR